MSNSASLENDNVLVHTDEERAVTASLIEGMDRENLIVKPRAPRD